MSEAVATTQQPPTHYSETLEHLERVGGAIVSGYMFGGVKAAALNAGLAFGKIKVDNTVYKMAPSVADSNLYKLFSAAGDVMLTGIGPWLVANKDQAFGAAVSEVAAKLNNCIQSDDSQQKHQTSLSGLWTVTLATSARVMIGALWVSNTPIIARALKPNGLSSSNTTKEGVSLSLLQFVLFIVGRRLLPKGSHQSVHIKSV